MKIDNKTIPNVYQVAKQFYEGILDLQGAKDQLKAMYNLNPNSTADYMYNLRHLLDNGKITRTLNAFAFDYYLENILKEYGRERLSKALDVFNTHIEYYEGIRNTNMYKLRDVYYKYTSLISSESDSDESEQAEIIEKTKQQGKSKQDLLAELKDIQEIEPEKIEFSGKAYKRENYIIAKIKMLRGTKCQICNTAIMKKNGTEYIEAAHITPKNEKGKETLDNIILLCPNHHKEFDLGSKIIKNRTKSNIEFSMNGKEYNLLFYPEGIKYE